MPITEINKFTCNMMFIWIRNMLKIFQFFRKMTPLKEFTQYFKNLNSYFWSSRKWFGMIYFCKYGAWSHTVWFKLALFITLTNDLFMRKILLLFYVFSNVNVAIWLIWTSIISSFIYILYKIIFYLSHIHPHFRSKFLLYCHQFLFRFRWNLFFLRIIK